MIVVDTSVWIDFFNGVHTSQVNILRNIISQERLITGDLILIELLQGFRDEKDFIQAKRLMSQLAYYDMSNRALAMKSVDYYRQLRRKGITIRKTMDVAIATFCLHHHFTLLHNDRDFKPFEEHFGLLTL